jgi:hypothetical protein
LQDFVTTEEEAELLGVLDVEGQWDDTAISRRVQHFG